MQNKERFFLLLSQMVIAVIGLVTGKIIAIYFTPDDFGLFNLQFAVYTFFLTLLVSPFIQYMKTVSKTLLPKLGYQFFLYLAILLMVVFYSALLIVFALNYGVDYFLFLILAIMIPSNLLFNLISDYFNIQNRLNLFSVSNLLKNLGGLLFLGALFLINYKYSNGSTLLWLVQVVGFLIGGLLFLPYYRFKFSNVYKVSFKRFFKKYSVYAWPLTILAFWSWMNNYFDRFAIEYYLDVKEVGIYNANYTVGSKFFILLNPFFLTLLVPNVYNSNPIKVRKAAINKYAKLYTLASIPVLLTIYLLKDFVGKVLLSESYQSGFYLIFWIALAYFFLTLVYLYETIFYAESKTKVILYSNIISAIFNVLLNVLLIPIYGLNGAFMATLTAFGIRFIVIQYYYRKL